MNLLCKIGIHKPEDTMGIHELRMNEYGYFDIVATCQRCGKVVRTGSLETPPPAYMVNWEFICTDDKNSVLL